MRWLMILMMVASIAGGARRGHAQPVLDVAPPDTLDKPASTTMPVAGPGSTEVLSTESSGSSAGPAAVPLEGPLDADAYVCGPGDVFELNFWGQQNFRLRIAADLEGRAFISKVGFVAVAGKTLTVVRGLIRARVRAYYPGLNFEVALIRPRSFLVHAAENLARPGALTATALERVSSIVARAGGVTGSRRRIELRRRSGAVLVADLVLYELTGDTRHNPYVLDGDVIHVPFAQKVVAIGGAVRRPGSYELIRTGDLAELLELAGGFTSTVARSLPIRVVARDAADRQSFTRLPFQGDAPPNQPLADGDRIEVPGVDELQRSVLLLGAVAGADPLDAATAVRRLPYIEGDTVKSLIDRAGGLRTAGDLERSYISRPRPGQAPELMPIDLEALLTRRDFTADRPVQMGDMLVVPAMQHSIRVEGAVARAGFYPYNPRFGIAEYVTHAGGRTRSARDLDDARLIDRDGNSRPYRRGLRPSPGDAILIPERTFTRPELVQIAISTAGLILSGVAITIAATR